MYKYFWILIFTYQYANACDFCSCSPAASGMDVADLQPQSMISASMAYRKFDFLASDAGLENAYSMSYALNGSYSPAKWMDIRINLPLVWMKNIYSPAGSENELLSETNAGLGDMQLFANFLAWKKPGFGDKKVGQQLNFGVGMEFPTGRKHHAQNELMQNFNFGSQSFDFLFSGIYSLSIRKWGVAQSAWVKINTYNKEKVKFGNTYAYQVMGNYSANIKKSMLLPVAGAKVEVASHNLYHGIIQRRSGYWLTSFGYGMSWMKNNCKLGAMVYHPLAQETSNGDILQKTNFNLNFSYQFKNKKNKQ